MSHPTSPKSEETSIYAPQRRQNNDKFTGTDTVYHTTAFLKQFYETFLETSVSTVTSLQLKFQLEKGTSSPPTSNHDSPANSERLIPFWRPPTNPYHATARIRRDRCQSSSCSPPHEPRSEDVCGWIVGKAWPIEVQTLEGKTWASGKTRLRKSQPHPNRKLAVNPRLKIVEQDPNSN